MTRPLLSVYRWFGHGDIRAILDHPEGPLFHAGDVCTRIDFDVDTTYDTYAGVDVYHWPAETIRIRDLPVRDGEPPADFFTAAACRRAIDTHLTDLGAYFLEWMDNTLEAIAEIGLDRLKDEATPVPEAVNGRTYSVRLAASILSRDPIIAIGQGQLFDFMHALGWTHRGDSAWVPEPDVLKAGHLVEQRRRVPGRKELYPQLRLTATGIHELHQRLGGLTPLTLDTPPALTLLELE